MFSASWTAFMMTLLLFVAPLTASTLVDCVDIILAGITGSAFFPIQEATCRTMTMSVMRPSFTATVTVAEFGQLP